MASTAHHEGLETTAESPVLEHLLPLRNLARTARRLDLCPFESRSLAEAERVLHPLLNRLLTVAAAALDQLIVSLEAQPREDADDWLGLAGGKPPEESVEDAAGVCVLARMEMVRRLEQFRGMAKSEDLWEFLICCNEVRGSLIRAAAAVEAAVCRQTLEPPELISTKDMENALEVREEYLAFQKNVLQLGPPAPERLHDHMLRVAAAMAGMIDSPNYRDFRTNDRFHLRKLEIQISDWLAQGDQANQKDGLHLWQEIAALSSLFLEINHREELIQHDRQVVMSALDRLYNGGPLEPGEKSALHEELGRVHGRDPELEELVARRALPESSHFLRALTRCALRLDPPAAQRVILG